MFKIKQFIKNVRGIFMGKRFVVSVETVKIKNFLFSTNRLKVIRGASYLLDYLNQIKVPEILKKNGVKEEDIIYVGAGNAKFFVNDENTTEKTENTVEKTENTTEKRENIAEKIEKEIKELYNLEAPGVHIACAHKETNYGTANQGETKIWDDLKELGERISIEKSKGFAIQNIDMPFIEKCEICGENPAQLQADNLEEDMQEIKYRSSMFKETQPLKDQIKYAAPRTGLICEECLKKMNAANHIKKNNTEVGFYKYLNSNDIELKKTEEIEDYANDKSFIGFMYSDGDGLGDFLKNVSQFYKTKKNSEDDYITFLKGFSKTLDETTKKALFDAIREIFEIYPDKDKKGEFLIVGGDDVCAVFDPEIVIEISRKFQEKFENSMKAAMKKKLKDLPDNMPRITSSCGVIIAKCKTPMYQLFDQAMVLQKNAKKERHEFKKMNKNSIGNETGFIDFQVIGSEGCVDINRFRESLTDPENLFMERPYSIRNLNTEGENSDVKGKESDIKEIKPLTHLLEIVEKLKKNNFPKTKIRQIYDLKRSNKEEFEKKLEIVDIISKMDPGNMEIIMEYFKVDIEDYNTFNNLFTNIFDILEIYDFVGGANNENQI